MQKINGLKISLCQMKVTPGRPDINAEYIIREINFAKDREVDIIVFPEMCTTGYLIGDMFEDICFLEDVMEFNRRIVEATRSADSRTHGITAIFGTPVVDLSKRGEDGRPRTYNAAIVAQNGELITRISMLLSTALLSTAKSLQPDYRFFNDDKHFYSLRKSKDELDYKLSDLLLPLSVKTRFGEIDIGVILCEDMWWHLDYAFNPTKILVDNGAKIIFNLSASPWTWQKNRKRHQIVKDLLKECRVPFVYVNNTGTQNTGKNIITFDGSSTVYNADGDIVFEVPAYAEGSRDVTLEEKLAHITQKSQSDTEELYAAMTCATPSIVPPAVKIFTGLSGGVDSAVVTAHLVDVLGPDRVCAINMPMPFNSKETRDMAALIARNLGIEYRVISPADIVEAISKATGAEPNTLTYENVQARARMEILAAEAQKVGGVFTCNSNKVEVAFGYGTLYGDIAGLYAPLGDLVKREVRQIADYINRVRFEKEVIPVSCINQTPTAELKHNQKDPFDYGDLHRRGYHDEMVRAFTEFRKNPEWFLELYIKGKLETELKLEQGTLSTLFPTAGDFIKDLRGSWTMFQRAFFKRIQCPPIPVFSKRAFGRDLEESVMTAHFTERYLYLEKFILSPKEFVKQLEKQTRFARPLRLGIEASDARREIAIYGSGVNPPSKNHELIVEKLVEIFDTVIIVPRGIGTKPSLTDVAAHHRIAMTLLAFRDIRQDKIRFDFYDLENNVFTPTYLLQERYTRQFPDAELYFVIGGDIVAGGRDGNSEIQREWIRGEDVWRDLKFAVISHLDLTVNPADLPTNSRIIEMKKSLRLNVRSTFIRERLSRGESIEDLVRPEIAQYIKERGLYK